MTRTHHFLFTFFSSCSWAHFVPFLPVHQGTWAGESSCTVHGPDGRKVRGQPAHTAHAAYGGPYRYCTLWRRLKLKLQKGHAVAGLEEYFLGIYWISYCIAFQELNVWVFPIIWLFDLILIVWCVSADPAGPECVDRHGCLSDHVLKESRYEVPHPLTSCVLGVSEFFAYCHRRKTLQRFHLPQVHCSFLWSLP